MKRDLTETSRSQSRTTRIRAERISVPKRLSVVSTLAFLAFVLLGMCGAQKAQAQVFKIEPLNPQQFAFQRSRGEESLDPTFRVTLVGGTGGKNYSVNLSINGIANSNNDIPQEAVDYDSTDGNLFPRTITLQPGQTRDVTLDVYDDESFEQETFRRNNSNYDEMVQLTISNPTSPGDGSGGTATLDPARTTVTYGIIDNDALPILRVRDTRVAIQDNTDEARFPEGSTGTTTGGNFTVELVGAQSQQPGFRNNQNNLVLTTSIIPVTFNYSYNSGNGTDPTTSGQRAPGSATLGTDFIADPNTAQVASIAAGVPKAMIPFLIIGDTQDENNEAFIVNILNPRNTNNPTGPPAVSNPGGNTGFGVILDDDAPVVTVSDASVTEGNAGQSTQLRFSVSLSAPSVQPVQLAYFNQNGTAVDFVRPPNNVSDYNGVFNILTFAPGSTLEFINITVNGDNVSEGANTGGVETFNLIFQQLSTQFTQQFYDADPNRRAIPGFPSRFDSPVPERVQRGVNFANNDNTAQGTIIDDDIADITIDDAQVVEGDGAGQTTLNFRISIPVTQRSENAISVTATTSSGTPNPPVANTDPATPVSDYVSQSSTVTIPATQTEVIFSVSVQNDDIDERNETLLVTLTNNSPGTRIQRAQAVGLIIDNDGPTISIGDVSLAEGAPGAATIFNFPVTVSGGGNPNGSSVQDVSVNYRTIDGTAVSTGINPDYNGVAVQPVQTLTIPAGQTTGTIPITVIGDNIREAAETFRVILSGAQNAAPNPFTVSEGTGTILNDDAVPTVTVADVSTVEGNDAPFVISLVDTMGNPARSDQPIVVNFSTGSPATPNSATPGADFGTITNGSVTFNPPSVSAAGDPTTKTIFVSTVDDTMDEVDEQFNFNLTGATNATIGRPQAIGTILDNDTQNVSIGNVTKAEGNSGTTDFVFPITLGAGVTGAQNAQDITLNYTVADGTATAPSDYQAIANGTVVIPAGQNTASITVPVVGDTTAELDETFTVTLSLPPAATPPVPDRATLVNATATGRIQNDDTANISFTGPVQQAEGDAGTSNFAFTVQLSTPSDRPISVNYNTTAGTVNPATPGVDFTPTTDTITFAPGATTQTINVAVIGDTLSEANETFVVNLSGPTNGAVITGATATGTILDDDGQPSLAINDVSVLEGDSGMTNANFTVTLTPASGQAVTVNYNTSDGTATAGSDYATTSGTLTFLAGQTSQVVTIPVLGDTLDEINETFTVNLVPASATNATVADAQGQGTITDDDGPSIAAADVAVGESAGAVTIPVTLRTANNQLTSSPQAISVDYSTADISATAGSDYTAKTGTLTFPANSTAPQNITIAILNDAFNEATETFAINFTNPTNAIVGDPQTVVTINDDDAAPTISIGDATVTEGNTGTVNAVFNVNLNTPSLQNVTVAYTTASGTATVNTDFASTAGNLVFAPGQTSKTITVPVNGDTVSEGDETFTVNLSGPTGATIAKGVGLGTIIDDDLALLTLNITPNTLAEGNAAQGTVTRNTQAQPALTVTLTSSNPSLVAVPATVTIPAGSASATFPVQAVEDQVAGPGGSSTVTARATNFTPASATVGVTDNDTPRLALSVGTTLLTEGGASATATLSRNTPTDVDLTVSVASSDTNSVTVPPTVTIPAGQQSVTFAVTPVDNAVADGTRTVTISAARAGFTPPLVSVTVTVNDNDNAAVVVTPTTLNTAETGTSASFTVRLASQPTANVVVNLVNGDTTEGALSTTSLTFTPQNFAQEQVVTVTGVDDQITDGPITYFITTTVDSTDTIYASINPDDVQVTNTDNDVAGFIVTPRGVRTTEAGGSGTFSIRLTSQPTANVVIGLSVDNPREATLSTSSLTFTPQNFASPQAVVVTGRNDDIRDGTVIYNIITAPAVSGDRAYNGLNPPDVKAASTDNDASSIVVRPNVATGLEVTEGQRSFFTIRLSSEPTSPVRISLSSSDPSEASLPQPVIVLDRNNFREGIQVPVDGVLDNVADGPQRFLIRTDSAESADRLYNLPGGAIPDIGGVCRDIDRAALIIAGPTSATTSEDGTSTRFSVRLASRPVSPVRVQVASSDLTEGVVENSANATLLIFTADNFSTPQIVTVTGRDDAIEDGPQRYNINLRAQTASGTFSNVTATVPLVNLDNDDLTKPVISLTGVPGRVLRPGDLRAITGQATDANGVARVNVVIQKTDGATPTFLNADGSFGASRVALPATFNATTGQFSLAIPGGTLPVGTYVVEATATDRAGNVSAPDRLTFTISDQLIAITITTPVDGSVITGATNVTGSVRSATGSAISTVTVTLQSGNSSPRNVPVTLTGNNFSTGSLGALPTGTYTVRVTAADAAGNRQTATSTFSVDTVAPTAVTITNPTNNAVLDNITTISGTASDNAGGSGIARVEVVILRNTDGRYFNGRTFVSGFATAPATVSGNNFVLNISGGLPADPDPLNATYTLQAIAFDRADNSVRSEPILVFLSSNGSAPGTPGVPQASQVQLSPFTYSSGEAKAAQVILKFTGALNASAAKADNYQVTVNGAALEVDSAAYRGSSSQVSLADSLAAGDEVEVTYNLQDAQGRTLKGKVSLTAR